MKVSHMNRVRILTKTVALATAAGLLTTSCAQGGPTRALEASAPEDDTVAPQEMRMAFQGMAIDYTELPSEAALRKEADVVVTGELDRVVTKPAVHAATELVWQLRASRGACSTYPPCRVHAHAVVRASRHRMQRAALDPTGIRIGGGVPRTDVALRLTIASRPDRTGGPKRRNVRR